MRRSSSIFGINSSIIFSLLLSLDLSKGFKVANQRPKL